MDSQVAQELSGTIERIVFQSQDSGYAVCMLSTGAKDTAMITGTLAHLHPGEQVRLTGSWTVHPRFGKQFEVQRCSMEVPTSIVGLKRYLSSGLIKGIGPAYAQKLIDAFGSQVLEIIDKEPERLRRVEGIGAKRAEQIITAWQDQKEISSIMVWLQDKGISTAYAVKMYKKYGALTIAMVQDNPYRLAEELWGVGFKLADQIAQAIGIAPDSIKRVKAALSHTISQDVGFGNLYIPLEKLKEKTAELIQLDPDQSQQKLKTALHELHAEEKIKLITHEGQHYITLTIHYTTEKNVATLISNNLATPSCFSVDVDALYARLRSADQHSSVQLNEDQQRGIMSSFQHKITVITGGPGTGKTTLIKQLIKLLEQEKLSYKLTAPTGRAAKRMSEGTGRSASTIHRLLEFDFLTHRFTHNEQNALKAHMLIVDESSMIDITIAHALLKAVPLHAHVVFIGDVDQLPSVGAGNFLHDLIASDRVPCIRLTQIFRQAQDSMIIINAHNVNKGEFPVSSLPDTKRDFIFIKEQDPEMVKVHIKELLLKRLGMHGITSQDATVLVPMNRGVVGTITLNQEIQQMVNPGTPREHITVHGTMFKVGDRVMQVKNNYDKIVFNGDCGVIESIDMQDKMVHVSYGDRSVVYEQNELDELMLAYALSIHKSQGSEYAAVIIPIFMQHFTLLQRNLIYTAITRAKRLCILIGQPKAIAMAIKNNKGLERITFLKEFLTSEVTCR